MTREREIKRRTSKKEPEPVKINYRIIIFLLILITVIILKLMPSNVFSDTFGKFITKNTDYPAMFSEIKEVIIKHTVTSEGFSMPLTGKITSDFGERRDPITNELLKHFGIDIDARLNTEVYACGDGTVIKAETNNYYGNFIMIDHGNGLTSLYGHLNELLAKTGDSVKKQDIIGLSGDSGRTTGPHLHFEIRKDNIPVNPGEYISYEN